MSAVYTDVYGVSARVLWPHGDCAAGLTAVEPHRDDTFDLPLRYIGELRGKKRRQ